MDKSIRILTTALLVLLMTGSAMGAVDVTLERYDKNGDGVIDADERIMLDIDIQNARIRVSESMFVGGYTTTGSLLLNDEFQDFAFADRQIDRHTAVADPEPIVEPKVIVTQPPPPTQTPVPPPTSEDDEPVAISTPAPNNTLPIVVGMCVVMVALVGVYLYYRQKRDLEASTDEK